MKSKTLIFLSLFVMVSCNRSNSDRSGDRTTDVDHSKTNKVKMRKNGGVYYIPIKVNGVSMEFIFDTGASIISISKTEASFLYKQGKIKDSDILGTQNFIDANGDVSQGVVIRLDNVQIGNRTLRNVKASVVNNSVAPLLLGQSALGKFGSFTIDNKRGYLIIN
jgi:aspartyl protease family protein